MLYRRPLKAASRIIDRGRFWFALCAALLVLFRLQAGVHLAARPAASPAVPVQQNTANKAQTEAGQEDASPPAALPLAAKGAFGPALYLSALLQVMEPAPALKVIGALALAFVPPVILVTTLYCSHEIFPVMLRKDYLSFNNCVLFSRGSVPAGGDRQRCCATRALSFPLILALLAAIYFLVLVAFSVQTLWGSGMRAAAGASLAGSVATVVGLGAFMLLGLGMYYLSSPFFCTTSTSCLAPTPAH
jgi:hypothetical protein